MANCEKTSVNDMAKRKRKPASCLVGLFGKEKACLLNIETAKRRNEITIVKAMVCDTVMGMNDLAKKRKTLKLAPKPNAQPNLMMRESSFLQNLKNSPTAIPEPSKRPTKRR